MRDVLFAIGFALFFIVALGLMGFAFLRQLRGLFMLVTGRVPMYKIVRVLVVALICGGILAAVLIPIGRKMSHAVEPQAESCVLADDSVRSLLGEPLTFGSARGIHFEEGGETGSGGFSLRVQGHKATGDLDVEAEKVNGVWHLSSVTLDMDDKRLPIPVH